MPILSNPRHERFAQELAKGTPATEAYEIAGYKRNDGNASTLKADQRISKRVKALLDERDEIDRAALAIAVERLAITKERVLEELAKIGFANMADYMRAGPDGDPFLDFSALTRDQAAPLAEVTVEDFKDGRGEGARDVRRVKFKLHDKKGALVDIGRHLGMFKERIEHTGKDGGPIESRSALDLSDLDDDELIFLQDLLHKRAKG